MIHINEAFAIACGFKHEAVASLLLDRSIALDPELGAHVDGSHGRRAFIKYFIDHSPKYTAELGPWKAFVMERVRGSVSSHSDHEPSLASPSGKSDVDAFVRLLPDEPWLLGDAFIEFQAELIGQGHRKTADSSSPPRSTSIPHSAPPESQPLEFAFTYARTHLVPLLTRIRPLPDDLPHAAGMGDLSRVKQWLDESGAPALGDVERHYPNGPYMPRSRVEECARQWGAQSVQRVLDSAFAWSVINGHLDVADFLLAHGADINTSWSSHEPASILHELVFHANYESMQFLIDRGIDMTIRDHRWHGTAQGWALHAAKDEKMAQWLADAQTAARTATMMICHGPRHVDMNASSAAQYGHARPSTAHHVTR